MPRAVSITIGTSARAAQLAAHVAPVAVGEREVEQHEVGIDPRGEPRAPRTPCGDGRGGEAGSPSARENGSAIDGSSSTNRITPLLPEAWRQL